jgi:anthranilate/para-aminobenzoate synthase component II
LTALMDLLCDHKVEVCDYMNLSDYDFDATDCIVLSWWHSYSVENHRTVYQTEMDLILSTDKPLFGICLWFQLICAAYRNHLEPLINKVHWLLTIQKTLDDPIFAGIDERLFTATEAHRWSVPEVSWLDVLARSAYGVEAVKVPWKLHYGVQFHPEKFVEESVGSVILENFLSFL